MTYKLPSIYIHQLVKQIEESQDQATIKISTTKIYKKLLDSIQEQIQPLLKNKNIQLDNEHIIVFDKSLIPQGDIDLPKLPSPKDRPEFPQLPLAYDGTPSFNKINGWTQHESFKVRNLYYNRPRTFKSPNPRAMAIQLVRNGTETFFDKFTSGENENFRNFLSDFKIRSTDDILVIRTCQWANPVAFSLMAITPATDKVAPSMRLCDKIDLFNKTSSKQRNAILKEIYNDLREAQFDSLHIQQQLPTMIVPKR